MNTARGRLQNRTIRGCQFHFSQAVNQNIVSLGLQAAYLNVDEPTWGKEMQQVTALPFVPVDDNEMTF